MTLTLLQRLERIRVRAAELEYWRSRETVQVDGWTFDAEPIAIGLPGRAATVSFILPRPPDCPGIGRWKMPAFCSTLAGKA